jgi:hypothetical protein
MIVFIIYLAGCAAIGGIFGWLIGTAIGTLIEHYRYEKMLQRNLAVFA